MNSKPTLLGHVGAVTGAAISVRQSPSVASGIAIIGGNSYLAGHNRPVHEVLFSNDLPLDEISNSDFVGMTAAEIPLQRLIEIRQHIRRELPKVLTDAHRCFLLSFVRAEPDWSLMPFEHLKDMPAIRWKLFNLKKLCSEKALLK